MSRHLLTSIRRYNTYSNQSIPGLTTLDATNGFTQPLTADTGTKWVLNKDGVLVQSPADTPAMPGCRFADGVWYPTDTDGADLYTVEKIVRTPRGSVKRYAPDYPGVMVEPAATNKCICRKVNPTNTTNISLSGDAAAVLSVVDDTAALTAAGLIGICTSGKVYKLDNSAGPALAYATLESNTVNTNVHSVSAYARLSVGVGFVRPTYIGASSPAAISGDAYARYSVQGYTPTSGNSRTQIRANAGAIVYFIMPELVESAFLGTPVMPKPTEDGLSTVTRPADIITRPTPSWLMARKNDFWICQRCKPIGAGQVGKFLLSFYSSANAAFSLILNASDVTFRKRLAGSNTDCSVAYTHAAATLFEVIAYQSGVAGMGLAVRVHDGDVWGNWSAWDVDVSTVAIVPEALYNIGATGNATDGFSLRAAADFPWTQIGRIPSNLQTAAQIQAWLVAEVA